MKEAPKYSVIIPVYNRPEELDELLKSLTEQSFKNFEVIIVEDGSVKRSEQVFEKYLDRLSLRYLTKPNSGPGPSRNLGYQHAAGDYFVVFDSDCIVPPQYFDEVEKFMKSTPLDAWGGPDRGHEKFTPLQQAMAYTMSSVLTTGGIRGGKNQAKNFQPRSFNMGISRTVFEKTAGFNFDRAAEDIEYSIRIRKMGFRVGLIPEAFVYHKRRATLSQFFKQVRNFGKGRAMVGKVHPGEIKVTHWFPTLFLFYMLSVPVVMVIKFPLGVVMDASIGIYLFAILVDGSSKSGSVRVGVLSMASVLVQMVGYGIGFLKEMLKR